MKNILFFLLITTALVQGQATFNHQMELGFPYLNITSVLPTDSCYYAVGIITDTSESFAIGNIFIKFDLGGEVEYFKKISNPLRYYETWWGSLTPTPDGGFLAIGSVRDSVTKGLIIKYDGDGDTLFTKEFTNPLFPEEDFIYSVDLRPDGQGNYWVLCGYGASLDPAIADGDIYLIKIGPDGNILKGYTYGDGSMQNPNSMLVDSDGGVVIGSNKKNTNVTDEDYTSRTHIFKVDNLGLVEWQYFSPAGQLFNHANDMLRTDDGGLVVATGKGIEYYVVAGANKLQWFPYMFKLDANQNFVWGREFRGTRHTTVGSIVKIVPAADQSGYVAISRLLEDVSLGEEILGCWIVKTSITGDSVWARYYSILDGIESKPDPWELKNTPDGGYIISGYTHPKKLNKPQAWLMKLDGHGCLVPGCEIVGTDEAGSGEATLAIYPNPAADYLNFQLRGAVPEKDGQFRILDAAGKVVRSFGAGYLGDTFILPVSEWAVGAYFLQYVDGENGAVVSEKFVKL